MFYDFESSHYSQNSASYVQLKFRNSSPLRGNQPPEGHETLPDYSTFRHRQCIRNSIKQYINILLTISQKCIPQNVF